ncbi:hypothetical protein DEO72_LG8g1697 [Vigna unguiculata]|uniref:Uncharacterized protein n=1 Tax=Vigna unguiculata TaxID=3917 RepID=A0A4D6MSS1_VIGUN|nr:hypothetical protein DEO72_LG8g1697 [Vigna unguiculata]
MEFKLFQEQAKQVHKDVKKCYSPQIAPSNNVDRIASTCLKTHNRLDNAFATILIILMHVFASTIVMQHHIWCKIMQ